MCWLDHGCPDGGRGYDDVYPLIAFPFGLLSHRPKSISLSSPSLRAEMRPDAVKNRTVPTQNTSRSTVKLTPIKVG
jgi:hypothetical protein